MGELKRKSKIILLNGPDAFIRLLAYQFGTTAECEINLIKIFIKYDMFTPFCLDKHMRNRLRKELGSADSTLGSAIERLTNSGVIAKNGKNVYVNIAFRGLEDIESIVFKRG